MVPQQARPPWQRREWMTVRPANRIREYAPNCRVKYNSVVDMPVYYILNNAALYCSFTPRLLYLTTGGPPRTESGINKRIPNLAKS